MKAQIKKTSMVILFFSLVIVLMGCQVNKNPYVTKRFMLDLTFGDLIPIVTTIAPQEIYDKHPNLDDEMSAITNRLDDYYSTSITTSKIYELNSKAGIEPVEASDEMIMVLKEAIRMSELSLVDDIALYDITVSPIVDLWDINNYRFSKIGVPTDIPTKEDIEQLLPLVDYKNIVIDEENNTVFLKEEGMKIDLGSILKGYAANLIRDFLTKIGIVKAVINVAGNIITMGLNYFDGKDLEWKINIQTPYVSLGDKKTFGYVTASDITAVTSGSYERFIVGLDMEQYHHILDPRTGYPSNSDILSVTILTNDSMTADAMSTATFCLGLEQAVALVESMDNMEAIFVTNSKEVYITSGLAGNFVFNEKVKEIGYVYKGVKNGASN